MALFQFGSAWHSEVMSTPTVIVPVDFSEVSLAALDHGRWMADRMDAALQVVAVTTPRYLNVTDTALKSLVDDQSAEFGVTIDHKVVTVDDDDIERALVGEVLESPQALWCIGSRGRTALGELLFGSVSADLVRDSEVPLVVVGRQAVLRSDARVLAVALDGSDMGETILPAAVALAQRLGLGIRLLQGGHAHVPGDATDSAYLARLAERLPHPERADYETLQGDVDDELVGYLARTDDVAMLAMATRGIPAGARISVPSTAMRVLRRSPVPILMLHPAEETPDEPAEPVTDGPLVDLRRRVIVGIDTRRSSAPAVEWAAGEAERLGAILQVVHTWSIPVGPGSMYGYPIWPDIEASRQAALEEVAETAHEIAASHPSLIVETIVAEGDAAAVISERSEKSVLVVLGRHRHGRLAKLLLGSTSESALHKLNVPLVIVPCDEDESED